MLEVLIMKEEKKKRIKKKITWISHKELINEKKLLYNNKEKELIRELLFNPIPPQFRLEYWLIISGAKQEILDNPGYYDKLKNLVKISPNFPYKKSISLDLHRTFPSMEFFKLEKNKEKLNNILSSFALRNSVSIGYVKGLNFVAAQILLITQEEEQAFWIFTKMIEDFLPFDFYLNFSGVKIDTEVSNSFLIKRLGYIDKNEGLKLCLNNLTTRCFISLYSEMVNGHILRNIWDIFFVYGDKVLFETIKFIAYLLFEIKFIDYSIEEIQKEIIDKLKIKNNLMKLIKKLDDFISKRLKNKAIETMKNNKPEEEKEINKEENDSELKDINIIKNIHLLRKYVNTCKLIEPNNKNNEDNNLDENKIVILPKKNLLFKIKKEENKENKENKENNNKSSTKKRIAYRIKTKKTKKKKNKDKKNLKKALDKWKRNSKLIKNNDIFDKYEKKVLQDLFKVCKKIADLSLKKYFDKWKNNENKKNKENKEDNLDEEILKYKKKPKIEYKDDIVEEYEQDTMIEKDSFRPTYILPKQNLYIQVIENPNIDESINENIDSNIINNNINEKSMPYIKKYGQRNYHKKSNSYYNNYNNIYPINQYYKIQQETPQNNQDILNNTQTSENSSEESYLSGVTLIQNNKEIKEPRNYTSQSFFIEKNKSQGNIKAIPSNCPNKNEIYKINQIPNMMKGDFENFIERNPKIFEKKNPRIQVTRSTCDLSNIYNNGIININNDDKYLSKIVKKCDYDLYANQKSKSKKDKWYSMSIPINQLRQGPNYKKINKNEMIEKNENDKIYSNYNSIKPYLLEYNNEKNNYTLQEMNCSQYYRSPMRSIKRNKYDDKFQLNDSVIKIPGKQRRNIHKSLSPFDKNKIKNGN